MTTWPKVRLDECCEIVGGSTPSTSVPSYWGGNIPWATPNDLSDLDGVSISDTPRKLTEAGLRATSSALLPAWSILFSSRAPIGHVALNTVPMATNQGFKSLIPQTDKVHAPFLYWWLRTHRTYLEGLGNGATFKEVSKTVVSRIEIPLPSLAEQRRIAEVLDCANGLRVKRRTTIAHLDALTQSMFFDMFGDAYKNSKQWPQVTLSDVIRGQPNNGIFRKNPEYAEDGKGLPVVWVEELFRGAWIDTTGSRRVVPTDSEISKYGLQNGDILFCRSSLKLDGIAFSNVYLGPDDGALFECHVIRVQPDADVISSLYLNALLRSPEMRAIAKSKSNTATMTTIDQAAVCSLPVMLPPRQVQEQYALRVVELEKLRTTYSASLAYLDALFASLQHRAFRGEL